jgi:hypothetical protein
MLWVAITRISDLVTSWARRSSAFDHELRVAGEEPLVHQEDIGRDGGRQGEAQPDVHAGRIAADRHVDELAQAGEGDDPVRHGLALGLGHAAVQAMQDDVLASGEKRIHAGGGVDQRADLAADAQPSLHGLVDARQRPQQRGLSRAVRTHQRHTLAAADGKGELPQGRDHEAFLGIPPDAQRAAVQQALLQGAGVVVIQRKIDGEVFRGNADHRAQTQNAIRPRNRVKKASAAADSTSVQTIALAQMASDTGVPMIGPLMVSMMAKKGLSGR